MKHCLAHVHNPLGSASGNSMWAVFFTQKLAGSISMWLQTGKPHKKYSVAPT